MHTRCRYLVCTYVAATKAPVTQHSLPAIAGFPTCTCNMAKQGNETSVRRPRNHITLPHLLRSLLHLFPLASVVYSHIQPHQVAKASPDKLDAPWLSAPKNSIRIAPISARFARAVHFNPERAANSRRRLPKSSLAGDGPILTGSTVVSQMSSTCRSRQFYPRFPPAG